MYRYWRKNLLEGINRSMHSSYDLVPDACMHLKKYQYPGNVRELRNILFIAATRSHNRRIDAALIDSVINNLPHCVNSEVSASIDFSRAVPEKLPAVETNRQKTLKDIEAQHIKDLLDQYQGNRKKVADALGISERTIYRKLKGLGIH